jgi:hypothetical protein
MTFNVTKQAQRLPAAPFDALAYNGMQVNGSMDVSQANATNAVIGSGYVLDGWAVQGTVATSSAQIADAPPGYNNSIKVSVTTAIPALATTDYCMIVGPIEGCRCSRLAFGTASAQSVSIGFWTKIHRPGTYSGALRNPSNNRSYVFTFTQNAADTWEYKTVTIPGDIAGTWPGNVNTIGLQVSFVLASGATYSGSAGMWTAANLLTAPGTTNGVAATTDTFQITGVVVLPGIELPSAARAPFIMRPWDQELLLCSRYYSFNKDFEAGFILGGIASTSPTFVFNHTALVPFRTTPTLSLVGATVAIECLPWSTGASLSGVTVNAPGHWGNYGGDYQVAGTSNVAVGTAIGNPATITGANQIKFDARL